MHCSGVRYFGFKFWLCYLVGMWFWAFHLTSLSLVSYEIYTCPQFILAKTDAFWNVNLNVYILSVSFCYWGNIKEGLSSTSQENDGASEGERESFLVFVFQKSRHSKGNWEGVYEQTTPDFLGTMQIKNDPGCLGSWPGVSLWSRMEMTHSNCEWINGWKPGGRTQEGPGSTDGWRSNSTSTHANSALAPYKLLPNYRSPLKKERDPSIALRSNLQ